MDRRDRRSHTRQGTLSTSLRRLQPQQTGCVRPKTSTLSRRATALFMVVLTTTGRHWSTKKCYSAWSNWFCSRRFTNPTIWTDSGRFASSDPAEPGRLAPTPPFIVPTVPWRSLCHPKRYYREGVRRYGFHGLSYEYIAARLKEIAPDIAERRVIVAHLGSGASMCALAAGNSIEST